VHPDEQELDLADQEVAAIYAEVEPRAPLPPVQAHTGARSRSRRGVSDPPAANSVLGTVQWTGRFSGQPPLHGSPYLG